MLEKEFSPDALYNRIVRYYMDKKGYDKLKANNIAQSVVQRESQRRICRADGCGHFSHDHIRNRGVCLVSDCECTSFVSAAQAAAAVGQKAKVPAPGVRRARAAA